MVFQGFSLLAMVLTGIGVIAYHFYANRETYFHETPQMVQYSLPRKGAPRARRRGLLEHSDKVCSICMESMGSATVFSCSHEFHPKCISKWLEVNQSCPNCRCSVGNQNDY